MKQAQPAEVPSQYFLMASFVLDSEFNTEPHCPVSFSIGITTTNSYILREAKSPFYVSLSEVALLS